jgi:hypothetical protein
MQPNEPKPTPTEKSLMTIGHGLSSYTKKAWMFSSAYIVRYLHDHASQFAENGEYDNEETSSETEDARTSDAAAMMAAGRLEWLLRQTRPSLSGRLSERDIVALLDCHQNALLAPGRYNRFSDNLSLDSLIYGDKHVSQFVQTLTGFNAAQRLTLADALEQTWHRGMKEEGKSPKDFLATLGITLT